MLEVSEISKSFQKGRMLQKVLNGVSFSADACSTLAITGPSGSGKSTLLNIIGGLDRPDSGTVRIDGVEITSASEKQLDEIRSRKIGFIFQRHYLLSQCTILENAMLVYLADKRGRDAEQMKERAMRLFERVGLADKTGHLPGQLSVGECQRAALVRAVVHRPLLLLADEPTGSLDRQNAENVGRLLCRISREEKTALIVVSHSEELAGMMDREFVLYDGVLRERQRK